METKEGSPEKANYYRSKKSKAMDDDATETLITGEARVVPRDIIIEEILVRLPVKSILKFRCVSKSWLSSTSSRKFIKAHIKYSTIDPKLSDYRFMLGFLYDSVRNNVFHASVSPIARRLLTDAVADLHIEDPKWRFTINGSCHGLLCVSISKQRRPIFFPEKHVFLWNPSTKTSKKLPPPRSAWEKVWTPIYGIGYDEHNDDYNVVGLFWYTCQVDREPKLMVKAYSLKNDSWKSIGDVEGALMEFPATSVIFSNGRFHFVLSFKQSGHSSSQRKIMSLDLVQWACGTIEQPNDDVDRYSSLSIGISEGCISALYSYSLDYADIWILREYGVKDSWTKLARIPYVDAPNSVDNRFDYRLCILSGGKYLLARGNQLIVYDPQDDTFTYSGRGNIHEISSAGIYVESLVALQTI